MNRNNINDHDDDLSETERFFVESIGVRDHSVVPASSSESKNRAKKIRPPSNRKLLVYFFVSTVPVLFFWLFDIVSVPNTLENAEIYEGKITYMQCKKSSKLTDLVVTISAVDSEVLYINQSKLPSSCEKLSFKRYIGSDARITKFKRGGVVEFTTSKGVVVPLKKGIKSERIGRITIYIMLSSAPIVCLYMLYVRRRNERKSNKTV